MTQNTSDSSEFQKTLLCSTISDDGGEVISVDELKNALDLKYDNTIKRFSGVKTIGLGGIGSVLSGHESSLKRDIAIKILRPAYRSKKKFLNRFIREARATAQIEHPNIVPVHELGVMDELGVYFTMKKVEGENLRTIIYKINEGRPEYITKFTRNRLLEIFLAACNGVAFAHSKGIIHRDLKPANIMIGDFGEVLVMDWGLVKYIGDERLSDEDQKINLETNIADLGVMDDSMITLDGSISGTPAFMAPEQAGGKINEIDECSDLYSLGAILYTILTLKSSPFDEKLTTNEVLSHVVNNYFSPPRKRSPKLKIPKELEAVCLKAMRLHKTERYASVNSLIRDVRNFMENYPVEAYPVPLTSRLVKLCRRRPLIPSVLVVSIFTFLTAMAMYYIESNTRTLTYLKLADYNINQGNAYLVRAKNTYLNIHSGTIQAENAIHPERKYKLREELTKLEAEFNNQYDLAIEYISRIEALGLKHEQITSSLARIYRNRLEFSILTGNYNETRKLIEMLRLRRRKAFYDIIENDSQLCESVKMIIQSEGKLSVNSTPSDVRVTGYRVDNFHDFDPINYENIFSAQTPLENKKLANGSYILIFKKPELPEIRYPLQIVRGKIEKIDVFIPAMIPNGTAYIPAGTISLDAQIGESQLSSNKVFIPGFFIKKHKVSFGEYLLFWKSLASQSDRRKFMGKFVSESEDRSFMNLWDKEGLLREPFKPDMPVIGITGQAAKAYCTWFSEKTKMDCQLPSSYEWERAALGVADRKTEPSAESARGLADAKQLSPKAAQEIEQTPSEISVFGIFDMVSAVGEFTTISFPGIKGFQIHGEKSLGGNNANYNSFASFSNGASSNDVGFRYVIPLKSVSASANSQAIPVDDNP
jgi:serine/threonine protein kinase/formylglycine-generating enzyme required for sulfatase activity